MSRIFIILISLLLSPFAHSERGHNRKNHNYQRPVVNCATSFKNYNAVKRPGLKCFLIKKNGKKIHYKRFREGSGPGNAWWWEEMDSGGLVQAKLPPRCDDLVETKNIISDKCVTKDGYLIPLADEIAPRFQKINTEDVENPSIEPAYIKDNVTGGLQINH